VPRIAGLGLKSVSRDAALLFYALAEPGPLPSLVHAMFGDRCNEAVAQLVLDGVLEVDHHGRFVSGASAHDAVLDPLDAAGDGILARLSLSALRHAQALRNLDAAALAERLYACNRQPLSPYWARRFPSPESLAEHLDSSEGGAARRWLQAVWTVPTVDPNWRHFQSRYANVDDRLVYKLYVSPRAEHVAECFGVFVAVLSERRAPWFKVGRRTAGVLRPDKMIAYFDRFDALQGSAEELAHRLAGMPAHGVPFTAELDGDGLLSWGSDPPDLTQVLIWQRRTSWRLWVCRRLAVALVAAREQTHDIQPWQFALQRLQLAGVNPNTYAPDPSIWTSYRPELGAFDGDH